MNRFNLFFMFLSALVSSALHYSISEEEKLEKELRELIFPRQASQENITEDSKKEKKGEEVPDFCKQE